MSFSVNRPYTGWGTSSAPVGDQFWFDWKSFMKGAGGASDWTVIASGDGLAAFSTTTDVITQAAIGANGMANPKSWFILREPDNGSGVPRHEILVMKPNFAAGTLSASDFRIQYYSVQGFNMSAGWASSAVSAVNPPIANDAYPCGVESIFYAFQQFGTLGYQGSGLQITPYDYTRLAGHIDGPSYITYNHLSDTTDVRYAHFYKSDAAPWVFYAFTSTKTGAAPDKGLYSIWGMDKASDNADYAASVADDAIFFARGSSSPAALTETTWWRQSLTYNNVMHTSWSKTRQATFSTPLATWSTTDQVFNMGLFNSFRHATSIKVCSTTLLNSGADPVFPLFWYEGSNRAVASVVALSETAYGIIRGKSQLFSAGTGKTKWSLVAGSNNWLALPDGTVNILWNGTAISG
jgi:hypothetical protein